MISVVATDASGAELGQDPIVFTVTRSVTTAGTLAVSLAWSGTAAATDYTVTATGATLSGTTLTFAAGASTATITVKPVDDTVAELYLGPTLAARLRERFARAESKGSAA